jgi:hypothetical protein
MLGPLENSTEREREWGGGVLQRDRLFLEVMELKREEK